MRRRHFLGFSALSLGSVALPSFLNTAFAADTPLTLPAHLKNNPLLQFGTMPNFADFRPNHLKPAIDYLMAYQKEVVQFVSTQDTPTWANFYLPLQSAQNKIERAWHIASHLNSVKDSKALRAAYDKSETALTNHTTWLGMYRPLYDGFVKLKNSREYTTYNQAQKQAIDNALQDFRLSGIDLPADKAARFKTIVAKLSELSTKFSKNILDAVDGYELIVTDKAKLAGLSQMALEQAAKSAKDKGKTGYRFTLHYPSYKAIMTYADDRSLRQTMYEAYSTRASDKGPNAGKWDNTPVINEILALRYELAQLLGFKTYADYALVTRMAKSPQIVTGFLNKLLTHARPKGKDELDTLKAYGKKLGIDDFKPWDLSYLSEKQRSELYSIDDEMIREYFVEDKVLAGLFDIAHQLFGITIKEQSKQQKLLSKVWHDDVRVFDVYRDSQKIAALYMDIYARENKRGGAWMNSAIERKKDSDGNIQMPVAHIVCNFSKPLEGKPSLLLHDEVTTLFHEFGHSIHQMLTQIDVMAVSGINGVAWDAVEFPSQLLENWTWDKQAIKLLSAHHKTGESLPDELINKMIAAKNYQAALYMVRQLEYGLFDFRLNLEYDPTRDNLAIIRDDIKNNVSILNEPEWTRTANAFSHIFAGGYAAGYYSYMWADVLSSDAFTKFEQTGIFNPQTGHKFWQAFLSQGGSKDPMSLFVDFMGRTPDPDALLKSYGIL